LRSAPGTGRNKRNGNSWGKNSIEAVKESDVLVGNKYVHEAAKGSLVVQNSKCNPRVLSVNASNGFTNSGGFYRYFSSTTHKDT
jgi:hypothetical protein